MKDIVCKNIKEYKFIKNFLDIELIIDLPDPLESYFPIILFRSNEHFEKWIYLEYITQKIIDKSKNDLIFANEIIRKEKINKLFKNV